MCNNVLWQSISVSLKAYDNMNPKIKLEENVGKVDFHSHVLDRDVFEDLAVVDVPHRLVVPNLGGQQDCTQHNSLPRGRRDVNLSIGQQPATKHNQSLLFLYVVSLW